jgi:hypothetical protein
MVYRFINETPFTHSPKQNAQNLSNDNILWLTDVATLKEMKQYQEWKQNIQRWQAHCEGPSHNLRAMLDV